MLPSSTVENYLKTIYLTQVGLPDTELVPMGHVASALGVAPGTATTMVKALADAGLVQYEPYSGVRLLPAGERLATLVLRRHRLVELFLVEVMGMSWAEVHDEAEQLEHVVSDRLIERMDEMLGHPRVDPHGDPIPGPEGTVQQQDFQNLLTCPLGTPVTVTRVADQNPAFLRFVEESHLKPGQKIEVEARDGVSDSVRVRGHQNERVTIGTRAASKLLVQVLTLVVALLGGPSAGAQPTIQPPDDRSSSREFEILDNSFIVEEAFNQEAGIFQNIFLFTWGDDGWVGAFTQEWPLASMKNQFSYTVPFLGADGSSGLGDVFINYRYQAMTEGPGRPAFAPRLSVILPSGDRDEGRGFGTPGLQVNLPFSKQARDVYFHWNAGFTFYPDLETDVDPSGEALLSPHLAGSAIWRMMPLVHLMFEMLVQFRDFPDATGDTTRRNVVIASPGMRLGRNFGDKQLVVGLAAPVTRNIGESPTDVAFLGYVSYELPFR